MAKLVDTITDGTATFKVRKMVVADAQPETNNDRLFLCADKSWKEIPETSTPDYDFMLDGTNSAMRIGRVQYFVTTQTGSSTEIPVGGVTETTGNDVVDLDCSSYTGTITIQFQPGDAWFTGSPSSRIICFRIKTGSTAPSLASSQSSGFTLTTYGLSDISLEANKLQYVYVDYTCVGSSTFTATFYAGASISLS